MTTTAPGRVIPKDQYQRDRGRVFDICKRFGLTRGDRIELATVLLDRNVESYKDLSHVELHRLRDALEGAALICWMQMERRAGQRR